VKHTNVYLHIITFIFLFSFTAFTQAQQVVLPTEGFGCLPDGRSTLYTNLNVYWGDLHSHTTNSSDAALGLPCHVTPYQAFLSCTGYLDFVAVTDHAEPGPPGDYTLEKWTNYMAQINRFISEGHSLIIFPAFEYTCSKASLKALDYPVPEGNGHKCILFENMSYTPPSAQGWAPLQDFGSPTNLWTWLDSTVSRGHYWSIPHHAAKGTEPVDGWFGHTNQFFSMATDWSPEYVRSAIMPFTEIYSRHGSSEVGGCEEPVYFFKTNYSVVAALQKWHSSGHNPSYKLGIVGSTDTHAGNPGYTVEDTNNLHGVGPYTGGLAAFWAQRKEAPLLWESMRSKNIYGSSGEKIMLEFTAKLGNELGLMGSTVVHPFGLDTSHVAEVHLHLRATASCSTGFITRVELFRNEVMILQSNVHDHVAHVDFTDIATNDYVYYRAKVWEPFPTVNPACQFERAWSSPIWIEPQLDIVQMSSQTNQWALVASFFDHVHPAVEYCGGLSSTSPQWQTAPCQTNAWGNGYKQITTPIDSATFRFIRLKYDR
jgi:hypothetical protein